EYGGGRRRRFEIRPEELRAMDERLDGGPDSVVGFYHSHPDHPARPSEFDRDHAWPWYLYLVQSVERGRAGAVGVFELDPERREFEEVTLELRSRDSP
ncbi:MAG: Mov34/MPN/PAD-1 family protein, partial [Thermoplasmata archaeon]